MISYKITDTRSLYWSHYWQIVGDYKKEKISLAEMQELLKKLEQKYGENK
jgi:flagellar biosynthesis component FlhA